MPLIHAHDARRSLCFLPDDLSLACFPPRPFSLSQQKPTVPAAQRAAPQPPRNVQAERTAAWLKTGAFPGGGASERELLCFPLDARKQPERAEAPRGSCTGGRRCRHYAPRVVCSMQESWASPTRASPLSLRTRGPLGTPAASLTFEATHLLRGAKRMPMDQTNAEEGDTRGGAAYVEYTSSAFRFLLSPQPLSLT